MPHWKWSFDAIDPNDTGKLWTVGIPHFIYEYAQHHGDEKRLARLVLINDVLCPEDEKGAEGKGTDRIYRGWSRHDKENCFVYEGSPVRDFYSFSIGMVNCPPPNAVFLVFVLPDGAIDDWNWRHLGPDGNPEGMSGEVIWTRKKN
jgi:hypothetical protein